jgi:outer membrane protein assembly factor BamA
MSAFLRSSVVLAACVYATSVGAQESRADLLAEQRDAKAKQIEVAEPAPAPGVLERTVSWAERKFNDGSGQRDGLYPEMSGMIAGAGLAAGPGYRHRLFGDRAQVDMSAAVSWRRYGMMQTRLEWPALFNNRLSLGGQVKYQDFTQVNFFGVGDDSLKSSQTDYQLKDLDVVGFATLRPKPWLSIGGRAGFLRNVSIEAGKSTLYPATTGIFTEATAPGLIHEPDYLHADVFVEADSRDVPGYPTSGGQYRLAASTYHDRLFSQYSFHRVEADAVHYVPIFHKNWVVALRGRVALSEAGRSQVIPFYLLPTLGGSSSLRGFEDYRFRDRDLMLFSAEYRWPLFRAMDGALFYDAGRVAPSAAGLVHQPLHTDYGVGFRVHSSTHTLVRLDVARGPEGTRTLLTFSAPLRLPTRTVVPYVP